MPFWLIVLSILIIAVFVGISVLLSIRGSELWFLTASLAVVMTVIIGVVVLAKVPQPLSVVHFKDENLRKQYQQEWCSTVADCSDGRIYIEE